MRLYVRLWWAVDNQGVLYLIAEPTDLLGRRRGRTRALFGWHRNLYKLWWLYRARCPV